MVPGQFLLCLVLFSLPPEFNDPPELGSACKPWFPIMQALAISWQIMDEREVRFVLGRVEDFPSDMALLRRRSQDLRNAPPAGDAQRFPCREAVTQMLTFNREMRKTLEARLAFDAPQRKLYQQAIVELDQLHALWDTIRESRSNFYYVSVRRLALKKAKEAMGAANYFNGSYPPPVPAWIFQEIR